MQVAQLLPHPTPLPAVKVQYTFPSASLLTFNARFSSQNDKKEEQQLFSAIQTALTAEIKKALKTLENGQVNIQARQKHSGNTLLHHAVLNYEREDKGYCNQADRNRYLATPLDMRVERYRRKNLKDFMRKLIAMGLDINTEQGPKATDILLDKMCPATKETPLHLAVSKSILEMVQFLLQLKANVNAKTSTDETPFDFALKRRNYPILQALIDSDQLDLSHTSPLGETYVHKIATMTTTQCLDSESENLKILQWLIDTKKMKADTPTKDGVTPFTAAFKASFGKATKILDFLAQHDKETPKKTMVTAEIPYDLAKLLKDPKNQEKARRALTS